MVLERHTAAIEYWIDLVKIAQAIRREEIRMLQCQHTLFDFQFMVETTHTLQNNSRNRTTGEEGIGQTSNNSRVRWVQQDLR